MRDAQNMISAKEDVGYGKLEAYLNEIKKLNPGSVACVETSPSKLFEGKKELTFAFLMLDCFARAVINSKIKLHTLDGGHIYGDDMKYIALIIETITPDANRIPYAVVLCGSECEANWKKFVDNLLQWNGVCDGKQVNMLGI
jgi:hypothetical protein